LAPFPSPFRLSRVANSRRLHPFFPPSHLPVEFPLSFQEFPSSSPLSSLPETMPIDVLRDHPVLLFFRDWKATFSLPRALQPCIVLRDFDPHCFPLLLSGFKIRATFLLSPCPYFRPKVRRLGSARSPPFSFLI